VRLWVWPGGMTRVARTPQPGAMVEVPDDAAPILLTLIWLLMRRWPKWMQKRAGLDPVIAFHRDGSPCRSRWCEQKSHF
jgi:hypothetical protein